MTAEFPWLTLLFLFPLLYLFPGFLIRKARRFVGTLLVLPCQSLLLLPIPSGVFMTPNPLICSSWKAILGCLS